MNTIVIIGAGGIGARHLQAIAAMDRPLHIQVVDISEESLFISKRIYDQVAKSNVRFVEFMTDISDINPSIDVAIVATSSKPRARIVEGLLKIKTVKNMILEKVLFPRLDEYDKVGCQIERHGCNVWVNCARRSWQSYSKIKKILEGQRIEFLLSGCNWGLACNSMHFIDLIAFLTDSSDGFEYDISKLDLGYIDSKRDGYIELTGTLTGHSDRCKTISLTSLRGGEPSQTIEILGEDIRIKIDEGSQKAFISYRKDDCRPEEIDFDVPFQSQLTGKIVSEILDTGACDLTTYQESTKLHKVLLKAFMHHLSKEGKEANECPIT